MRAASEPRTSGGAERPRGLHAVPIALLLICTAARAQMAPPAVPAKPPAEKGLAAKAAVPTLKDLKFPPLRPLKAPNVEAVTLPNGMRLFLLEDHELPVINGSARIRTGNLFDPPDKIGLAALTGAVMRTGGTKTKTGEQLNLQLENLAASVESGIGEGSGSVSFFALKESAGPVLEVFRDVLTAPEFLQDRIDLQKTQIRSAISRRNDDAGKVAERELTGVLYGRDTPFGWQEQYDTISRINRTDLRNFYNRYYFPKNVMLAVWGDFDTAAMKAGIAALFAGWTAEQPPVPEFPKVIDAPAPGIYLAEKKDVQNAFFALGHLGGQPNDKDNPALQIMADVLGGGFHSRLVERVRSRMGNAYDIGARWRVDFDHPGLFEISGSANPISIVETLKAIQEEVERIRTAEVTEDELRNAKDAALNRMVFAFDTKAKTMGRVLTYAYYGYPKDFLEQYQNGLVAVTRADVLRVARQHLNPANLGVVMVGNPVMFGRPLEALGGLVNKLDLTIPEPKPEAMKVDEASLSRGRQILLRAQQAAGGADKLAAVTDYTEVEEFLPTSENGGMKVVQTDRWIAPTTFRQDSVLPNGKISAYSDGRGGWISTPQGFGALGGAQLKQVQGDLFRLYFRLMLSDRIAGRIVNALDSTADIGVVEISDPSGQTATLECDARTGLPRRLRYDLSQATRTPLEITEDFDDFRDVGGVKIPHKITVARGGQKFADVTVIDYKVNTGLTVQELAKRP
jgi:zinc protease